RDRQAQHHQQDDQHEAGRPHERQRDQNGASLLKLGARRSRRLATPSLTSGPAKPMNSTASEVSKVGPIMRSQLLSAYLVQRIAVVEPVASRVATCSAVSRSSLASTQRATRPMRSASSPETGSHSSR